jgi:hypothetical protein
MSMSTDTRADLHLDPPATAARQPWSRSERSQLKKEAKGNTPTPVIALHLKRTESSIHNKAHELGGSLKPTNKTPYGTGGKRKK